MKIDHNFFNERRKNYLHFDQSISSEIIFKYVTDPKNIEQHSFLPFMHFTMTSQKVEKQYCTKKKKYIVRKKKPKEREIKYASHLDSAIYAYYSLQLSSLYEELLTKNLLTECVLAFRKNPNYPSNIHIAKDVFNEIKQRQNCSVLCVDIKGFFDNLDHKLLKDSWNKILNTSFLPKDHYQVYKSITKFSYVDKYELLKILQLSPNKKHNDLTRICSIKEFRQLVRKKNLIRKNEKNKGIPQGSSISAALSNFYMLSFDDFIKHKVDRIGGKYYRYCDDILIICNIGDDKNILLEIQKSISKINLEIQTDKTQILQFKNGITVNNEKLQYLGFTYDGKQILLRDSGLTKYSHKVMKVVKMTNNHLIRINCSRLRKNQPLLKLNKKHIYYRFSYLGKRNYITYALRAARIMNEPAIKKQVKPHWARLKKHLLLREELHNPNYLLERIQRKGK